MYFITCFQKCERDELGWFDGGCQRTFGYRETLESAEEALNLNMCDMREGLYDYAVIEKLGPYIHPNAEEEIWFKWDDEKSGFFRTDKPEATYGFCNYAFG